MNTDFLFCLFKAAHSCCLLRLVLGCSVLSVEKRRKSSWWRLNVCNTTTINLGWAVSRHWAYNVDNLCIIFVLSKQSKAKLMHSYVYSASKRRNCKHLSPNCDLVEPAPIQCFSASVPLTSYVPTLSQRRLSLAPGADVFKHTHTCS